MSQVQTTIQNILASEQSYLERQKQILKEMDRLAQQNKSLEGYYGDLYDARKDVELSMLDYQKKLTDIVKDSEAARSPHIQILRIYQVERPSIRSRQIFSDLSKKISEDLESRIKKDADPKVSSDLDFILNVVCLIADPPAITPSRLIGALKYLGSALLGSVITGTGVWIWTQRARMKVEQKKKELAGNGERKALPEKGEE